MKKKLDRKGFAMVETIVCIVVVAGIITMLYNLIYPIVGKAEASVNYEGLDTKYLAYYVKEMIETDVRNINLDMSYSCGYNCNIFKTQTYRCVTNNCGVDPTNGILGNSNYVALSDGDNVFNDTASDGTSLHYTSQNQLCNMLDDGSHVTYDATTGTDNKYLKNNKYFCNQFVSAAHITNIYITRYNTGVSKKYPINSTYKYVGLKQYVRDHKSNFKRSFTEYVDYMPSHINAVNSDDRKLLIVEQEHDATTSNGDKYYTYASIEVK